MKELFKSRLTHVPDIDSTSHSVAERISTIGLSKKAEALVQLEQEIPVTVGLDTAIRPKILDNCGMSCTFCHNEGTPVASSRQRGDVVLPSPTYKGGRVSVFEQTNGVNFLPGVMQPDEAFAKSLNAVREALGNNELHLTGGEPTLHRNLPAVIRMASENGFSVKMTSNGENGAQVLKQAAEAGLDKVNFSIFGTTPEELAKVQHEKYRKVKLAETKLDALRRSIDTALDNGIEADANIVMSSSDHAARVRRVIDEYNDQLSVRILNDLDDGDSSYAAIYELMADLNAVPTQLYVEAGSSNSRVKYTLPGGREIYFKQIRRTTLPETCGSCSLNNNDDCKEGFYGTRLYVDNKGEYKVGICLQRMDLTVSVDEFINSPLVEEINKLRSNELKQLSSYYEDRLSSYGDE